MKYNLSEIMKNAWAMFRNAKRAFSECLHLAWEDAKTIANLKQYRMKEWFVDKVANEIKRNLYTDEIFAILKETEKAVYAMLNLDYKHTKCVWIPKSCLTVECGSIDFHTRENISYEDAKFEHYMYWKSYV